MKSMFIFLASIVVLAGCSIDWSSFWEAADDYEYNPPDPEQTHY